jgi:hypothetical protein
MPKKDPMTGCMVMTIEEFAASEGTTVSGLLAPLFAELDDEAAARDRQIRADPMAFFLSFDLDDDEGIPPFVCAVECKDVTVRYGMRKTEESAEIYMIDARGGEWLVSIGRCEWAGTMWEPPDYDVSFDYKAV